MKTEEELIWESYENNKEKMLFDLATEYRNDFMEEECSTTHMCKIESEGLYHFLKDNGVNEIKLYHGLYHGASEYYEEPYVDGEDYSEPVDGYNHWWVVVDGKYNVDVTADQFHPEDPDQFAVVVTKVGNTDYSNS